MGPKKATPKPGTPKSAKKSATPKVKTPKATPKKATPKPVAKGVKRRASSVGGSGVQAKKMKIDTSRTPAKTPKTAKKSTKTPARSIKKSVKKRTWADVAKKTPAPKAKTSLTSKMAAHVQKQQRRKSGQALPTFRMDVPKTSTLPRCRKTGHALSPDDITISKAKKLKAKNPLVRKGRK